jgi:spore maturation protein CgeB
MMNNKQLKISFLGSSLVSAYWNGAATYYRGLIRELFNKYYIITFYEPDAYERQRHRDLDVPPWSKVYVYENEKASVDQMLEQAADADIIVKASGVGVFDKYLEEQVLELKRPGKIVIFWDVDAPATLERIAKDPDDYFHELIPNYDLVLTYGGGNPVSDAYTRAGARKCIPIYNALDKTTHYPVEPSDRFSGDIAFLGNRLPDREFRVDDFFLKPAGLLPDKQFILGGSGWHDKLLEKNVRYEGHIYTREHNVFNCSPKAVLNISRQSMADYGYSPATRIFEAAGAGACIITDNWEGIDMFLEPDVEILVANSGEEVADIIQKLSWQKAAEIGNRAYERITSEHTYAHRAKQVDKILRETLSKEKQIV